MIHGSSRLSIKALPRAQHARLNAVFLSSSKATAGRCAQYTTGQQPLGMIASANLGFGHGTVFFSTCRPIAVPRAVFLRTKLILRSFSRTLLRNQSYKDRNGQAYFLSAPKGTDDSGRPKSIVVQLIKTITDGGNPTRKEERTWNVRLDKNAAQVLRSALRNIFERDAYLDPVLVPDIVNTILKDPKNKDFHFCVRALLLIADPSKVDTPLADFLAPSILRLATEFPQHANSQSFQKWLWLISLRCSKLVFLDFVDRIFTNEITVPIVKLDTKLQWIARLGKDSAIPSLITIVSNLTERDFLDQRVSVFFTSMVRDNGRYPYELRTALASAFLELGLPPARDFINALIANAVDARDSETAWELYNIAEENGVKGDNYTFGHLSKLIVNTNNDEVLRYILAEVESAGAMSQSVGFDILLSLYKREAVSAATEGRSPRYFDALSSTYCEIFLVEPLRRLGMVDFRSTNVSEIPLLPPDGRTICLILQAFLQQGLADPDRLKKIYNAYLSGVQNADPVLKVLGKSTVVANTLMLAAGVREDTQSICGTIMSHLLKSPFEAEQKEFSDLNLKLYNEAQRDRWRETTYDYKTVLDTDEPDQSQDTLPEMPHPNQWSWSILLHSFTLHGKMYEAEAIMNLMKMEGVKPTPVSYRTILHGYVRQQDAVNAVDVLNRMEDDQVPIDDSAMQILGRIRDNRELTAALEASLKRRTSADQEGEQEREQEKGHGYETESFMEDEPPFSDQPFEHASNMPTPEDKTVRFVAQGRAN